MNISELKTMSNEIENEIENCENDLNKVGSLTIKTQSFVNLLSKQDENNKEIKILKIKANSYQKSARTLGEKKAALRNEFEQEMEDSKIRPQKISEIGDVTNTMTDNEFYANQSSKLDEFISNSMDSIESLRKQGKYIENINSKLKQGMISLGVSSDVVNKIESRIAGDKTIFLICLCLIILLIIILRFVF
jgi:hypothetical protein